MLGFRALRPLLLALGLAVFTVATDSPVQAQTLSEFSRSIEELSARVNPAVVQVLVTGYSGGSQGQVGSELTRQASSGSGVILDSDGYIITNAHVVNGAERVEVVLHEPSATAGRVLVFQSRRVPAQVVGIDFQTDLAVLKISETGLPTLPLADWTQVRQGQIVFAFGAPRGLDNSMTMGVVSTPLRQFSPDYPMVYIQTDAPINPGNSGGPLVNTEGEVVGINTLILSESGGSEGLGFALPSLVVEVVYQKIREKGWFARGDIGVSAQTITAEMAQALSLSQDWGAIVSDVHPQGPAGAAGLQVGDIIVAVDEQPVSNGLAVSWRIGEKDVGETIRLDLLRDGRRVPATIRVVERPGDEFTPQTLAVNSAENMILRLGIMAVDIQTDAPDVLPLIRRSHGSLVVLASNAQSPVSIGLREGDVIYALNGRDMETLAEPGPWAAGDLAS